MDADIRDKLEEEVRNSMSALISRKSKEYKEKSSTSEDMPFHEALLPDAVLHATNFERSFSTTMGSLFESCALIIAKPRFVVARRQYDVMGYIPADTIAEVEKVVDNLDKRSKFSNYQAEAFRIAKLARSDPSNGISRKIISDLYVKSRDGTEVFFEIKSPKPNKKQCLDVTRDHLLIHCIRRSSVHPTKTYYGMAYNPYGEGNPNKHNMVTTYLDAKHHVLIGKSFWDYLGGAGAHELVLSVFKKVGRDMSKDAISKTISQRSI